MTDPASTDPAATDALWRREAVESPCRKVCAIHPGARLCVGCLRTPEEIAGWARMDAATRRAVMAALPARAPALTAAGARPSRRRRARSGG